jgi:DNA-binding transcriptional MerR regulator
MEQSVTEGQAIAEVADLLGIPIPTIRSWERRYGFPAPRRTAGAHRRYDEDDIDRLRAVRDRITAGMSASEAVDAVRRAEVTPPGHGRYLAEVVQAAMRFDGTQIREALDRATAAIGVEAVIRDVALPAMAQLGSRWKAGTCEVGNEHVGTEGVRAWLGRQAAMAPPPWRGSIVMGCGPGDLHTIGLEAFGVLAARRGWSPRSLGAMTPTRAFVDAVRATHARAGVVVAQRNLTRRGAADTVRALDRMRGVLACYAGAAFAAPAARRDLPGRYLGEDVVAAVEVMERALGPGRRTSTKGGG